MGKIKALYSDPAWLFKAYTKERSGTPRRIEGDHYDTMSLEDMKALPVEDWVDKDCWLFMWVIDSHLPHALELGAAWGFKYSSIAFKWRKITKAGKTLIGMGKTTRKSTEICLLFKKGSPKIAAHNVVDYIETEWIDEPRREHSRKPDVVYDRIEALVDGPYMEMFARVTRDGWSAWGNEVGKFDKPKKVGKALKRANTIKELW